MAVQDNLFNLNAVPVVQSDSTVLKLVGIIPAAAGSLVIKNDKDETVTIVVPATAAGFVIWTKISRVMAATDIADANLTGLTLD